jgi:hypothetical protein
MGMPDEQVKRLTHSSICNTFQIDVKNEERKLDFHLEREYEFDAFKLHKM